MSQSTKLQPINNVDFLGNTFEKLWVIINTKKHSTPTRFIKVCYTN